MFKRVIKIILILLAIFLFILGVIWLIGRHKAKESNTAPLSFKQFLGLSTKQNTAQSIAGAGTANFGNGGGNGTNGSNGNGNGGGNGTNGSNGNGNGGGNGTNGSNGNGNGGGNGTNGSNGGGYNNITQVSQFTNGGTNPTGGIGGLGNTGVGNTGVGIGSGGGNGNGVAGSGATGTFTSTGETTSNNTSGDSTAAATAPTCGTADTTLTFSAAQLTELNNLQNQFYAIAATLHTDADADAELANHDAFEIKAEQATELYNQCEAYLPALTQPVMQEHAATPFWSQWNGADSPNITDPADHTPPNEWWDAAGIPQSTGPAEHDTRLYASNFNDPSINAANLAQLAQVHDSGNHNDGDSGDNSDTSGITGPYGLLSFSDPTVVAITGSVVKNNTTNTNTFFGIPLPNPLNLPTPAVPSEVKYLPGLAGVGTKSVTTNADWVLLVPVVEKILQINLW